MNKTLKMFAASLVISGGMYAGDAVETAALALLTAVCSGQKYEEDKARAAIRAQVLANIAAEDEKGGAGSVSGKSYVRTHNKVRRSSYSIRTGKSGFHGKDRNPHQRRKLKGSIKK